MDADTGHRFQRRNRYRLPLTAQEVIVKAICGSLLMFASLLRLDLTKEEKAKIRFANAQALFASKTP